jgi:hypothetical protein
VWARDGAAEYDVARSAGGGWQQHGISAPLQ